MQAAHSPEMLVAYYHAIRHHIPKDGNIPTCKWLWKITTCSARELCCNFFGEFYI